MRKKRSAETNTIKVALVDDVPLAIEGWKKSLRNEPDIDVVLETTPKKISARKKFPLPVEIVLIGAGWLATPAGGNWLRNLKGLDYRPKVIAMAKTTAEIRNAQKAGVDEAALSPVKREELANLVRGLSRDDKRISEFYAKRLQEIPQTNENQRAYEDLLYSILRLLFYAELVNPKFVERDNSVRALIFQNLGKQGFWQELRTNYGAEYIVFFLGSHNAKMALPELARLGNYLDGPFGKFGILCTRNDSRKIASDVQRAVYRNYQKIILMIDDVHLHDMLALKAARMDPLEVLQDLYEEIIGSTYIAN